MYTTNYKLFRAPRNRHLKRKTWIAHTIWNYFLGWQRTTRVCHVCDTRVVLDLSDRTWTCGHCNTHHDRDINAAINILKVGASTFGVENVRLAIASGS